MTLKQHINIAILGASGYTGVEALRLLLAHPHAKIVALTGDSHAGKPITEIYPHLHSAPALPRLTKIEEVQWNGVDLAICCLPHGTTQEVVATIPPQVRVIDVSADFRLKDLAQYAKWYGHEHRAPALQAAAVYGLSEHARAQVKSARIVANPGCYPTSASLPLIPLLKAGLLDLQSIIIDAKSGVSGAGRSAKQANLFTEIDGGISAYGLNGHRHTPEIEQTLGEAGGAAVAVQFTPHLMPMSRGILSTIYAQLSPHATVAQARATLQESYQNEYFVHLLPENVTPATHMVRGTNHCVMNVFAGARAGQVVLVSALDNLVKGASGQAVQNMNIMFGFAETLALEMTAVFP